MDVAAASSPCNYGGIGNPENQAGMILDHVRTAAFAEAIARIVQPGDVVIDAGTGSGILALLAARAGARKVYAIERTAAVTLAKRHVQENGYEGVVEVIRADVVQLDASAMTERARVIISETLGHFAPGENIHGIMAAASRLARRDAVRIPESYSLVFSLVCPSYLGAELDEAQTVYGLSLSALGSSVRSMPSYRRLLDTERISASIVGAPIDVRRAALLTHHAELRADRSGVATACAVSFEAVLADGVTLRSAECVSWLHTILPLRTPLVCSVNDEVDVMLRATIPTDPRTWRWKVSTRPSDPA